MTELSNSPQKSNDKHLGNHQKSFEQEESVLRQKEQIYKKIIEMVKKMNNLLPTDIYPQMKVFLESGLDSLSVYELVIDLESAFDIQISDDEIEKIGTVQDVVDMIYRLSSR